MMRVQSSLWAALIALLLTSGFLAQDSSDQAEPVRSIGLPPPPPLPPETAVPAPAPASVARAMALMAPPPPRAQCITAEQYNRAASGSGCSCTCEEYARKPVSDTCDIACGGHPHCWMPKPTDAEVNAQFDKAMQGLPAVAARSSAGLSGKEREDLRASLAMLRALEWSEARKCTS
ncbi:hypothetical protein ACPVPU_03350 [Sphingomonas sp. CJ99]